MRALVLLCLLFLPLHATYVLFPEKSLTKAQKAKLFDLLLQGEPPRVFYASSSRDLPSACKDVAPSLRIEWIPPMLWQLATFHAFFHDPKVKEGILIASQGRQWGPLEYEEMVHQRLTTSSSLEQLAKNFDDLSRLLPKGQELFFHINQAIAKLFNRTNGDQAKMLHLALSELPPFEKWQEKQFPLHDHENVRKLSLALQDEALLLKLLKIEQIAHEKGEWVLYRGYEGDDFPSTLEIESDGTSHALSFGSTLLGGAFFSPSATALTYSQLPTPHTFLALRANPKELIHLFRIGPLHPYLQMMADGEMFHAHTKIACSGSDDFVENPLKGYFMDRNKHCVDPLGYILKLQSSPEELEQDFRKTCERSGHFFSNPYKGE